MGDQAGGPGRADHVQRADRARLLRRPHRARDRHVAQAAREGQGREPSRSPSPRARGRSSATPRPSTTSRPPSGPSRSSARRPAAAWTRATRSASRSPARRRSRRSARPATGSAPTATRYVFTPSGSGPSLGSDVKLTLPHTAAIADSAGRGLKTARTVTWKVPPASPLRLIQLLAEEGYLPVEFDGPAVAHTVRAQNSAAADPPKGDFPWRYDEHARPSSRSSGSPRPAT